MSIIDYIARENSSFRKLAAEISRMAPFGRTISFGQLHNIARGTKGCDIDTALAIKEATGISLDDIAEPRRKKLSDSDHEGPST